MTEYAFEIAASPSPVAGYLVIDRAVDGTSAGGVRMRPDLSLEELRRLARDMTLKYGLLGIPQGGAKAGIAFDPEAPEEVRRRVLEGFGRASARLLRERAFIPGPDMGTTEKDIPIVLGAAGRPPSRIRFSGVGTGCYTGLSVFIAARAALAFLGRPIAGATVALEGFGKVGSAAAAFLAAGGARVVAVSTKDGGVFNGRGLPVDNLVRASAAGAEFIMSLKAGEPISPDDLKSLPVDLFCPCALVHSVDDGNWRRVRARTIAGGANSALTEAAEEGLHAAGTLVVPDFVSNCGGVVGAYLEIAGFGPAEIERRMPELLAPAIDELFREASRKNLSPGALARPVVLRRFENMKRRTEEKRGKSKIFSYRPARRLRPLLPLFIARTIGLGYFRRALKPPLFADE